MSNYIFQVILFQAAFYMVYEVFLKKETFFQWNRFYLILTSIIAYIIPVLKIEKIANSLTPEYAYMLPEIIYTPGGFIERQFNWSLLLMNSMTGSRDTCSSLTTFSGAT